MDDLDKRARELFEQVQRSTEAYNLNSPVTNLTWENLTDEAKGSWRLAVSNGDDQL